MKLQRALRALPFVFLFGCAGWGRSCQSCQAESFGADWVILQYGFDGTPINCWQGHNISVDNEAHSDGIYWTDEKGHLIHISGWYNRVQVQGGDFDGAAKSIGIELGRCKNGKYVSAAPAVALPPPPAK